MKKLLTLSVATLAVAGIVGIGTMNVSAVNGQGNANGERAGMGQGNGNGYQSSLESRAKVFGMTADELKTALQTKTMSQIAVERGMSEETFRAKMTEAAKARWESRGLSTEEIAKRLADRDARHEANAADHEFGSGEGNHQGGYRNNR
jgi:hypothetical protein